MRQFKWQKETIAESMGRKLWIFVRRLKMMRRMLLICLIIMILPGFLWAGNESSRRTDRLSTSGIYAYVADRDVGLRIVDVSDPANPFEVGFFGTPNSRDVYVSGNYAYVANSSSGLRIINVSDPSNPFEEGFYDTPGSAGGVYFSGNYAYVADGDSGLRIIDVSDPTNPFEEGFYDTYNLNGNVYVSGDYAYAGVQCVQNRQGLVIIDVLDPANPFEVSYYELVEEWYWVEECIVSGSYAYLAKWAPVKLGDIFEIIDGSDVSRMKQGYSDIPDVSEMLNGSDVLKIKQGNSRMSDIFEILDVSDPSNPFQVGTCDLPSIAMGVDLAGDYAYVAGWEHGLQIIDVKDPTNPFVAGSCNQTNDFLFGVYALGNYSYAADYVGCFRAYDISDPKMPFEVGFVGGMSGPYAVHVVDYEPPQVMVVSPNGGENFVVGETCDITWLAEDIGGVGSISILYSIDAGMGWDTIATGEANDFTYSWTIPDTQSDSCLVKILAYDLSLNIGEDQSDSLFSICYDTPPQITVIYPNGGEVLVVDDTCDITWHATDNIGVDSISIFYSTNAGVSWETIITGESNDSLYEWIIPNTSSDSCLVKVLAYDSSLNVGEDQSDSLFMIFPEGIEEDIFSSKSPFLFQISPNPFKEMTTISLGIGQSAEGKGIDLGSMPLAPILKIYDATGRLVKSFNLASGLLLPVSAVSWNGTDDSGRRLSAGVYFVRLETPEQNFTKEVILLR